MIGLADRRERLIADLMGEVENLAAHDRLVASLHPDYRVHHDFAPVREAIKSARETVRQIAALAVDQEIAETADADLLVDVHDGRNAVTAVRLADAFPDDPEGVAAIAQALRARGEAHACSGGRPGAYVALSEPTGAASLADRR